MCVSQHPNASDHSNRPRWYGGRSRGSHARSARSSKGSEGSRRRRISAQEAGLPRLGRCTSTCGAGAVRGSRRGPGDCGRRRSGDLSEGRGRNLPSLYTWDINTWAEREIGITGDINTSALTLLQYNFDETQTERKRALGAFDRFWSRQNSVHIKKVMADSNFALSQVFMSPV